MKSDIHKQKSKPDEKKSRHIRWILLIFGCTVLISAVFSVISTELLESVSIIPAFIVLLVIVLVGIVFDIIGVAVTAADVRPFHSMAAHRERGAREALILLKNAEKVSSFCNDVVGDICGIISGTASAAIVIMLLSGSGSGDASMDVLEVVMAALVSGLTVGGKALGKSFAMEQSTKIVHSAALMIYYLKSVPRLISGIFKKKN